MAKVVKLKQSDITKIVENIIKEQDMNVNDTDMGTQSIEKPGPDAHELTLGVDKDGNYLGVWTQNKELLAQQKEMLIGNNIYNVLSKEASDSIISAFEEININKYSPRKKISINLPQGIKEFELSISKKSDGNFLVLSRDISERS